MLKLLLYLLLTPTSEVPMISALPLEYKGEKIRKQLINRRDIVWDYGVVFGSLCLLRIGDELLDPDWVLRRERLGTKFFLVDLLLSGKNPKDVQYLLGRMQGRQYLYQPCPIDHSYAVWLDEWYELQEIKQKNMEQIPLPKKK